MYHIGLRVNLSFYTKLINVNMINNIINRMISQMHSLSPKYIGEKVNIFKILTKLSNTFT